MTFKTPCCHIGNISLVRRLSTVVPKTLTDLELHTGKLNYRSHLRELSAYLLINRLIIIRSVRATFYNKPYVEKNKRIFNNLINSSKYFNHRLSLYSKFSNIKFSDVEKFPNKFSSGGTKDFDEQDMIMLQLIFDQYTADSVFDDFQKLISEVILYLIELRKYPTYRLYDILIENFNKLGLDSISNQVYLSLTKLPGQISVFQSSENFLCRVDEDLLKLILKFLTRQSYHLDFLRATNLISPNSELMLSPTKENHIFKIVSSAPVNKFESSFKLGLLNLRFQFFPKLNGEGISTKKGIMRDESNSFRFMSMETCYLYLEGAHKFGDQSLFQLILRKWVFGSVITQDRKLKILINGNLPNNLRSFMNLQTVEDYAIVYNKKIIKLMLKHCYVRRDNEFFSRLLKVLREKFLVNHRFYLKYTYSLGVIDNETVALIWLNCKNLDYRVYETWILLEGIFELREIFDDFDQEKFIALSCK